MTNKYRHKGAGFVLGKWYKNARWGWMMVDPIKLKSISRARYNYEKAHGKIPEGYLVCHKNGDRFDDALDNLILLTRSELATMNDNKWHAKKKTFALHKNKFLIKKPKKRRTRCRKEKKCC